MITFVMERASECGFNPNRAPTDGCRKEAFAWHTKFGEKKTSVQWVRDFASLEEFLSFLKNLDVSVIVSDAQVYYNNRPKILIYDDRVE